MNKKLYVGSFLNERSNSCCEKQYFWTELTMLTHVQCDENIQQNILNILWLKLNFFKLQKQSRRNKNTKSPSFFFCPSTLVPVHISLLNSFSFSWDLCFFDIYFYVLNNNLIFQTISRFKLDFRYLNFLVQQAEHHFSKFLGTKNVRSLGYFVNL